MTKKFLLSLLISVLFVSLYAQVTNKYSFQGIIRDANNELVINKNVGTQISIIQGSATGSIVYQERHFPTTSDKGLVSFIIGDGLPTFGNISLIDWKYGSYFLKTEFDINGGANYTLSNTSQMLSVPFAQLAKTVESIPPISLNEIRDVNTDNVSLGQVLKWNGTEWIGSNDNTSGGSGPTYTAGMGINITASNVIQNTGDNDNSVSNEIQTLSLSGNVLTLLPSGGSVTLPTSGGGSGDNWGTQNVITNATLDGNGTSADPLSLSDNAVGSNHIINSSILPEDLSTSGLNPHQILKFNGTTWEYANDGPQLVAGDGIMITGNTANDTKVISAEVGGSGLNNYIPKWEDPDYLGTSVMKEVNGKIVVGNMSSPPGMINGEASGGYGLYGETGFVGVFGQGGLSGVYGNGGQYGVIAGQGSTHSLRCDGSAFFRNGTQNDGLIIDPSSSATNITSSNRLHLNASSDHITLNAGGNFVGIGTYNPSDKLHVVGDAIRLQSGSKYLRFRTDGAALDVAAYGSDLHLNANGNDIVMNEFSGKVGIGTNAPNASLSVNGTATKSGGGSWGSFSDLRLKSNIKSFDLGLEKLLQIKPVTYQYNEKSTHDTQIVHTGVIAQDLRTILPHMVSVDTTTKDNYLMVDPSDFIYISINAIKELNDQIKELKAEVEVLKSKLK